MSAAIKNSLNKLTSSLVKLEKAIDTKVAAPAAAPQAAGKKPGSTPQNDLFSAMTAGQANPSNLNPQNVRMLATRLDNAINQVEAILKEGRG